MNRSRTMAALGLAAAAALLQGCTYYMYEKGSVKHVDVQKTVSPPVEQPGTLAARVERDPGAGEARPVRLAVTRGHKVELSRTRNYNTIQWEAFYHPLAPFWEVLELATSPLYLLLLPPLVALDVAPPPAAHLEYPGYTKLLIATAPINPFCSIFGVTISRTEMVEDVYFKDKPVKVDYAMNLPADGYTVSWRVLAADGRELGKGGGATDLFGEIALGSPPAGAAAIEVSGAGLAPAKLQLAP